MNFLKGKKLPIGHFFLSLAAGLMLFLLPNEAKVQCSREYWELYVLSISLIISVFLLIIVKKYEAMGTALLTASGLLTLRFIIISVISAVQGTLNPLTEELTMYDMVSWIIIWFIPFVITVTVKLFAISVWNSKEKREGFSRFLFLSGAALFITLLTFIVCKVIYPYPNLMGGKRTFVLIPFMRIIECINGTHADGVLYILWHCILLIPIGFYLSIYIKKANLLTVLFTGVGIGALLELWQLTLNTGAVCFDDIMMYTLGAVLGYGLKLLIEKTRSVLTLGRDKNMLEIQYVNKNK